MTDYISSVAMHQATWGTFLEPHAHLIDIEDLHEAMHMPIQSGHHADLKSCAGRNRTFDYIAEQIESVSLGHEDLSSGAHYFDVFSRVQRGHGELTRVVEVGVFMGGMSSVLAGCVEPMGVELDLVDANDAYLQFTYERVRRIFPRAIPRIRMFHGDLPTYVHNVLHQEVRTRAMVHHDGAHSFDQVVKDLSALYFARDRVHSVAIHNTHLRGEISHLNFVDSAIYAIFGGDLKYEPLGANFPLDSPVTKPNQWDGNYFLGGLPEGMYIPFSGLEFKYPHPKMEPESFLPEKTPSAT